MTIPTSGYIKISATGKLEIIDAATVTDTTRFINQTVEGWFDVVRTGGQLGLWIELLVILFLSVSASIVVPAVRASYTAHIFFWWLVYKVFVLPFILGTGNFCVLEIARRSNSCDGLISYWPSLYDFQTFDVKSPEFLWWRLERMMKEELVLTQVHTQPICAHLLRTRCTIEPNSVPRLNLTVNPLSAFP